MSKAKAEEEDLPTDQEGDKFSDPTGVTTGLGTFGLGWGGSKLTAPKHSVRSAIASSSDEVATLRRELIDSRAMMAELAAQVKVLSATVKPSVTKASDEEDEQPTFNLFRTTQSVFRTNPPTRETSPAGSDRKPIFSSSKLRHIGVSKSSRPSFGVPTTSKGLTESGEEPISSHARASIKPPRPFSAKMRFEDWWSQFNAYLTAVAPNNISDEVAANYLIGALSHEVFATLRGCGLMESDLLSTRAIYNKLQSRFGDRISPALYIQEFPQLKQGAKESAAEFADRVRQIAHRAYPSRDEDAEDHRNVVIGQLLVGLKSPDIKRALQAELRFFLTEPPTLEVLYTMVRRIEDDELRATGKQVMFGSNSRADSKDQSHTKEDKANSDKASSNMTAGTSSQQSGSSEDTKKKSRWNKNKGKGNADEKDKDQSQSPSSKPQCQLCNIPGHAANECRKFVCTKKDGNNGKQKTANASDGGTRKEITCYRCKRANHIARNCYQTTDVDGQPLEPVSNADKTQTAGTMPSSSNYAATHLNTNGGARTTESAAHTPLKRW